MTPEFGMPYTFVIHLFDTTQPGRLKINPSLTAGDFLVYQGGTLLGNIQALPVVLPAGSANVVVALTAGGMSAERVTVVWSRADFEWSDGAEDIQTAGLQTSATNPESTYDVSVFVRENGAPFLTFAPTQLRRKQSRNKILTTLEEWRQLFYS